MTVSAPRAPLPVDAGIGALEGHVLVDVDMLVVGAGRDLDRVAGRGRVDRRLDGGVAAMADEQDIGRTGAVDDFSMPESVSVPSAPPVVTTKWPSPSSVSIELVTVAA